MPHDIFVRVIYATTLCATVLIDDFKIKHISKSQISTYHALQCFCNGDLCNDILCTYR